MGNQNEKFGNKRETPSLPGSNHLSVSGENAKHSGIYRIQHEPHQIHQVEKEVFIRRGAMLPFCSQCAGGLRFRLIARVGHIREDPDFSGM